MSQVTIINDFNNQVLIKGEHFLVEYHRYVHPDA